MANIFISYSRENKSFVDRLVPLLRKVHKNHIFWFDDDIPASVDWWQFILNQIAECDLFIYLISDHALKSKHCGDELREAIQLNKLILTVKIQSQVDIESNAPEELRDILSRKQYVDLSKGLRDFKNVATLFGAVNDLLIELEYGTNRSRKNDNIKLENVELAGTYTQWAKNKTGDIYWLASDLTVAAPVAREGSPELVKHYVRQTYWHVCQLKLGESIEERFHKLYIKTNSFSLSEWNIAETRQELVNELIMLLHAIAVVMENGDKEFKPSPPETWPDRKK